MPDEVSLAGSCKTLRVSPYRQQVVFTLTYVGHRWKEGVEKVPLSTLRRVTTESGFDGEQVDNAIGLLELCGMVRVVDTLAGPCVVYVGKHRKEGR